MRLFKTEHAPGGKVVRWYSEPNGVITRQVSQDTSRVADAVHAHSETARGKNQYYLGSVPETLCLQWLKEMGPGHTLLSREFAEYARTKLRNSDFKKLSTGIR